MVWDTRFLLFLNRDLVGPVLDRLMAGLTLATSPLPVIALLLLVWRRKRREGFALLLTFTLATLLAVGVQFLLGRPRPTGVRLVLPTPAFPSFPSGHAAGAFGCATMAALLWRRAGLPGFPTALLVSLSRVYLGHHYPSDVLGGAILGAATAAVLYGLTRPHQVNGLTGTGGGRPRWAWLLWGQVAVVLLATLSAYLGLLRFDVLALPGADKVLHFLLFGGLAFFSVGWWARRPAGVVLAILGLLTMAEETLQALSPTRSLDWLDLTMAGAGLALFGWLGAVARRAGVDSASTTER